MPRWNFVTGVLVRNRAVIIGLGVFTVFILAGHMQDLRSLLASTTSSLGWTPETILFFNAHEDTVAVGETITIDVRINAPTSINVIGTTLRFDPAALMIIGVSKESSFLDLWTEESIMHEKGEMRLSGGTVQEGGLKGPGTIITLVVRTKKEGETTLSFSESNVFAHDGKGSVVAISEKPFVFTIASKTESGASAPATPQQSADFNSDGKVTLADVSIFAVQLFANYHTRYDLNRDGRMDLGDLSVVFAAMNR